MDSRINKIDSVRDSSSKKPLEDEHTLNLGDFLKVERKYIKKRRADKGQSTKLKEDSFGIALSGGGIRSATLCLGVLQELNKIGFIEKADYLSSVSGGGYLASYIHCALNKSNPTSYQNLFDKKEVISHIRSYRKHLFPWPNNNLISIFYVSGILILNFILNWLWLILPAIFCCCLKVEAGWHYLALGLLFIIPSIFIGPNRTSLHRYYKNRLRKAYLWKSKNIKVKDLTNPDAPYPLINATVHVNKDDYSKAKSVSYRGNINTNYFLFSPLYCGSQVTHYTRTPKSLYSNVSLATAMTTSGAAVNTFMGNMNLAAPLRWFMVLLNIRTGYLAPSPFLKNKYPVFWQYYTILEILGKARTTSYKIQLSDGGHIENLGVYELLRRQVKTIFIIDGGQDGKFDFSDLRNLIVRARNELGTIIEFDKNFDPMGIIKRSSVTGTSNNYFSIAKISGLKGSYVEDYQGVLVYIKSTVLPAESFQLRSLKKEVERLRTKGPFGDYESKRRELDHVMYSTYTPDFPHQTTTDQFFSEEQWDAYYNLGSRIGNKLISGLNLKSKDERIDIFNKAIEFKINN